MLAGIRRVSFRDTVPLTPKVGSSELELIALGRVRHFLSRLRNLGNLFLLVFRELELSPLVV